MDFSEALKLLKQGKTVKRADWSGTKHIKLIRGYEEVLPYIEIITKDGKIGIYCY